MAPEILAVNPGSTSTKIAWFSGGERLWQETVNHDPEEISAFARVADQYELRMKTIEDASGSHGSDLDALDAVVGRGGLLDPVPGGTYRVDEDLVNDLRRGKPWEHASNLGGIIADAIARPRGIPAFIVDPVAVDELDDISRLTGLPEFNKRSLGAMPLTSRPQSGWLRTISAGPGMRSMLSLPTWAAGSLSVPTGTAGWWT